MNGAIRRVAVLFFDGCPNHRPAVELVRDVAQEFGVRVSIDEVEVGSSDEVAPLLFLGSPTIQVDGVDVEPEARSRTDFAFSCRVYNGKGVPSREMIIAALCADGAQAITERRNDQEEPHNANCCP